MTPWQDHCGLLEAFLNDDPAAPDKVVALIEGGVPKGHSDLRVEKLAPCHYEVYVNNLRVMPIQVPVAPFAPENVLIVPGNYTASGEYVGKVKATDMDVPHRYVVVCEHTETNEDGDFCLRCHAMYDGSKWE